MSLIVQKFGGTSVADPARIMRCAQRVVDSRRAGNDVVVVVSAMGHTTDELIDLAGRVSPNPSPREMDMLLSTGEQVSVALFAMAIHALGHEAVSLTGAFRSFFETRGVPQPDPDVPDEQDGMGPDAAMLTEGNPTRIVVAVGPPVGPGFGVVSEGSTGYPGYDSILPLDKATVATTLKAHGYATAAVEAATAPPRACRHRGRRNPAPRPPVWLSRIRRRRPKPATGPRRNPPPRRMPWPVRKRYV